MKWKKTITRIALGLVLLCLLVLSSSCTAGKMKDYYSRKDNYVNASGIVTHISYNEDRSALYLGFSDLNPQFCDNSFKIVGENLLIVQQNGIDEKIEIGDQVGFITAARYFGDGYVMPIVELSVKEEELLNFEDGFANFLKWLDD
ncbi:MAG: hypothetical protein ACI3VZ_04360 [Faecousia sp.]